MGSRQDSAGIKVVQEDAILFSASNTDAPAVDTDAVVTYAAIEGKAHSISGLVWSYSAAPVGNITIGDDGGAVYFNVDITADGAGFFPFEPEHVAPANTDLVITLSAGGTGVSGKLSVLGHRTD